MQQNFSWNRLLSDLLMFLHDSMGSIKRWLLRVKLDGSLGHVGHNTAISPPIYLKYPHKVWIGDQVEVRHGCGIYARSKNSEGIRIGHRCRIKEYCILDSYGGRIELGNQVLLGQGTTIHGHGGVIIGDYSLIGAKTTIVSSNHIFKGVPKLIQEQGEAVVPTTIGKNVWIGANVIVLAGVSIEDHCVIAAGAVVSKSIPSFSVAAGVPAIVIKQLRKEHRDS